MVGEFSLQILRHDSVAAHPHQVQQCVSACGVVLFVQVADFDGPCANPQGEGGPSMHPKGGGVGHHGLAPQGGVGRGGTRAKWPQGFLSLKPPGFLSQTLRAFLSPPPRAMQMGMTSEAFGGVTWAIWAS